MRRLGKKSTTNFLARYRYGNKKESGIKNIHINIRSMKNKMQDVKCIIDNMSPHIIGLAETELKKSTVRIENLKVPGYDILFPKSWDAEGIARVIVYVKETFQYEHLEILESSLVQSI